MRLFPTADCLCNGWRFGARALLDLLYPEVCVLCGTERGNTPWCEAGPTVAGLTWTDAPHLCRGCADLLAPAPVRCRLVQDGPPVHAGRATGPELVTALGQWKYHGVRGLAWPLSRLLQPAVQAAQARDGLVGQMVPIALHARRRRQRGFNQAEVLARMVAAIDPAGPVVRTDLLRRTRSTGQQAKLDSDESRRRNMAGAFAATSPPAGGDDPRVGLIDDLVTGGATVSAAAEALTAAGWQVVWIAALGLAASGAAGQGVAAADAQ
jgi:predicted amidophosphoribosyltransferase